MADNFLIKKKWNESVIKVSMDVDGVQIECSIDAFRQRLEDVILNEVPSMTFVVRKQTTNELFKNAFRSAWDVVTREMKEETVKAKTR